MRSRTSWRVAGALAGAAALVAVLPAAAGASVHQRPTAVTLALAAPAVQPGHPVLVTATVVPRVAGRAVTLKEVVGGRYVGVARSLSDRRGVATFRTRFTRVAMVPLRAFVAPTDRYLAAVSPRVVENVAEVLPLVLPSGAPLALGKTSWEVLQVQKRLSALGYWLGTPSGSFDDATQQAVYAIQKAAGLPRTGVVDPATVAAINAGVLPHPRTTSGSAIDVDLTTDLVMFVRNGKLAYVLNTSTGGGYTYVESGVTDVAATPTGVFSIERVVDGLVVDPLGSLWRPRFFYEGFALHGDSYVPPEPVSHGCVRVSNEAIDWVWANDLAPIGMEVDVYR